MEPSLTPPDPSDDPLEKLLCAAPPAIADDGFTARVCAALPPRVAGGVGVRPAVRQFVLSGAFLFGCLFAWMGWSSIEPLPSAALAALADVVRQWRFESWQVLLVVIVISVLFIGREERENPVV